MPQLLLELFSEEIPARMQRGAARDLERMARERLKAADLTPDHVTCYAGPRRLTLVAEGLPAAQAGRTEERKGPRLGSPEAALAGFLRSAGVAREALIERDGVYFASISRKGRPTATIVAQLVEDIVREFPWPKAMTWGAGKLRWVRPLQRILCLFDGEVVPVSIEGIEAADFTEGHRFMGEAGPFRVSDFDSYAKGLAARFVILDADKRETRILERARAVCRDRGLELVEDESLLEEVAGLAEWPVPILGDMDDSFLDLPPEVIRTSMRTHQKYFAVRNRITGALAPHFVVTANIEASDGGMLVAAGNARVLSARLKDARFFWDEDLKVPLESRLERLEGVTFHARLGTMYERVARIEALARVLAPLVGADPDRAALAARLAKADLASGMVKEFPELQGVMGGYYARAEGLGDDIADAIAEHYKPQGPGDTVPTAPVSLALALADKLDTLVAFFAIDERPTGSRDPYALRRAALGIIRILLSADVRMPLGETAIPAALSALEGSQGAARSRRVNEASLTAEVLAFFADRLKVALRDEGKRHDLVDAVFALGDDDIVRIVRRVEALGGFLTTEDGANLLAGYKRAVNILTAETKKGPMPSGPPVALPGAPFEEQSLIAALAAAAPKVDAALASEDFTTAMRALAALRGAVDAFFDKVLVNSANVEERDNRLRLLAEVRRAMGRVADFSLVSG
ncbi:MAG: glycine--tRNA ligase subunit beta [Caulobacterales bacterium]